MKENSANIFFFFYSFLEVGVLDFVCYIISLATGHITDIDFLGSNNPQN